MTPTMNNVIRMSAVEDSGGPSPALARVTKWRRGSRPHGVASLRTSFGCGASASGPQSQNTARSEGAFGSFAESGIAKRCRSPTHQPWTADRNGKRSRTTADVCASVPEPVCKPAPDARLCGRGWHDRWPPPARAPHRTSQISLREAFARPSSAPSRAVPADVDAVADSVGS